MFVLQHGKSYLWLFPVYIGVFFGGFWLSSELTDTPSWGVLTLPTSFALLLSCEMGSGVALDSMGRASYPKGTWQYRATLVWHAIGIVLFSVFSFFFIR